MPARTHDFESSLIDGTIAAVKSSLVQRNENRAVAAVTRHFRLLADSGEEMPLETLGIDQATCDILYDCGILSVDQLTGMTAAQLLVLERLGPIRVAEIQAILATKGLNLQN